MHRISILFLICSILFIQPFDALAQVANSLQSDTTSVQSEQVNNVQPDEEMDMFLFGIMFAGMCLMLGISILTIVAVLFLLLCVLALIGAGVLSVSVGVGVYRKSLASGVRTAVYVLGALIGCIGGAALSWAVRELFNIRIESETAILVGSVAGIIGGTLGAISIIFITTRIFRKFKSLAVSRV